MIEVRKKDSRACGQRTKNKVERERNLRPEAGVGRVVNDQQRRLSQASANHKAEV
jgi:hypothetical protein